MTHPGDGVPAAAGVDPVGGRAAERRRGRTAAWVLERVADAHVTLDAGFRFTYVNAAAERILGLSRADMLGRTHWEMFPASADNDAGRAYRHVVADGVEQHLTQHYTGEGYDRHLEIDAYPTEEGGVAIFWRDVTDRVRAQAALRESEQRFRLMADTVPQLVWLTDADGRVEFVNRRWSDYTGASPEPATVAALASAFVHPDDAPATVAAFDEARRTGRDFAIEHRMRSSDGGYRWFLVRAQPYRDGPTGEIVRWFGASMDIHDRKHAEAELAHTHKQLQEQAAELELQADTLQASAMHLEAQVEVADRALAAALASEARYRSLFDAIDEGFAVVEMVVDDAGRAIDHRIVEANVAFVRQTGLESVVGRTARELVPGIDAHWIEISGRVAATGEPTRFQQGSDAMGRWFDVYAFRVGHPEARRVAFLFGDVTAEKVAERERDRLHQALEVERTRLADVVRIAPAFMAVLRGPDHVIDLTNANFDALVGGRDVHGRPVAEALPEAATQGFVALLDRVLATGEPFVGREVRYRRPDAAGGEDERYLDFVYQALTESDGTRRGVFVHGVDVTEQVRSRHDVEHLLAEAEAARWEATAANQAKSGFLATMSHELRTPVNAVIGYAQLLDLGIAGPLTEQQHAYLERLAASANHLLGLVNDVLDLSKIEAGETRVDQRDGTTGTPVHAALDVVAPTAVEREVRLVLADADADGVSFVGDEDRVRQIVLNLLSNALKFTAAGGTVTVSCDTVATAPPSAAHLRGEGPWALVRVVDTGVGIAPDQQGRIFEPFHQVVGGHKRTAGGTGLGLTISRRLARLMDGDLTVESALGVGSTFTLWLPASRAESGQPAETAAERSVRGERDLTRLETPGLAEVGELLHGVVNPVIAAYTDRLRADPAIPRGAAMTRIQLEDHAISFLADLAQSLVIVGDAGPEAMDLLKDGSAIQRAIAEAHGARRHAQGWDEAALRRDQQVFREEVERAVRRGLKTGSGAVDEAVHVLLRLIDRGQGIAARAWRRAVHEAGPY